ncbi:hypothetical protein [Streptomyces sp. Tue6028]|uniref:hypothetical protein n=1 Tax=Streptomyces sp. Tue6028 TaxID=2036037 RepID=UPI003D735A6E
MTLWELGHLAVRVGGHLDEDLVVFATGVISERARGVVGELLAEDVDLFPQVDPVVCERVLQLEPPVDARHFPTVEVTLPWVDPARPSLAWEDRPKRTVRLLVTTQFTKGLNGGAINKDTFNDKHWKPALAEAGLIPAVEVTYVEPKRGNSPWRKETWAMPREFGFHVLRHTFASVVLAAGETITQLASWLGHSDPAFTLRTYVHFMPRSGSKGREAIGRFVSAELNEAHGEPEATFENGSPQILPRDRMSEGDGHTDGLRDRRPQGKLEMIIPAQAT